MASNKLIITKTVIDTTSAAVVASNDIAVTTQVSVLKTEQTSEGQVSSHSLISKAGSTSVVESSGGQFASKSNDPVRYVVQGTAAEGGKLNYDGLSSFPNIFLSFKNKTYTDGNLIFKLRTDNISSSVGTTSNNWTDDSGTSSLALTSATSDLKCVSSYGVKFYELASNKSIKSTAFKISPKRNPSYTVLVFALAKDGTVSDDSFRNLVNDTHCIHKFVENTWQDKDQSFCNFSRIINIKGYLNNSLSKNSFKSVFAGGALNAPRFISNVQGSNRSRQETYALNISEVDFYNDFTKWSQESRSRIKIESPTTFQTSWSDPSSLFDSFKLFNLGVLPNDLANPTTVQPVVVNDGSSVTYDLFSMFFVEMFAYFNGKTASAGSNGNSIPYEELVFETYVNGIRTYKNIIPFDPASDLKNSLEYRIELSNKNVSGGASGKMFLFDYLSGNALSESLMRASSKQIIESLAYQYRSILTKSTSELQIANSTKSLLFPVVSAHPYLDMYAKNKS